MTKRYKNLYTKHYFEEYARIVLNDLLGLNLMHREERYGIDKPDLISEDEKIGVEVTLAWSDDIGRHNKLFQQQYPKENRSEIIKNEAKRLRVEKDLYVVDNLASLWIPSGKENAIEMLTEAINKKVDKLNNNDFTKYRTNNLFVSAFTLFTEDIEDFLNQFSLVIKKGSIAFDAIYIFNSEKLFVFENDNIKKIAIPEGRLSTYKLKAMNNTKV